MFGHRARIETACLAMLFALGASACSDEDASTGASGASGTPGGSTSAAAGGNGSGAASGVGGSGAAGTGGDGGSAGGSGGAGQTYAAMVRGTLASGDLAQAKAAHDAIARGGQNAAQAAGDFAHDVLLGTTLLDSVENEFFALDRWTDADAMQAFYADPMVAEAFGSLFVGPPTIEYFVHAPEWESWGDMASGDAHDPYWFHLALGDLAEKDTAKAQVQHDQVAAGGKQPSMDAGNVAHVIFLGLDDPSRFCAVDIWGTADVMEAFYTNPQFVAAFAPLFESVSQPVYQSTDWYQW